MLRNRTNRRKHRALGLLALGALGLDLYRRRRRLLARLLGLPPPRYAIGVTRSIPVAMPDGVRLMTDHYYPRAAGRFPTVLVRSYYGRGSEFPPPLRQVAGSLGALFAERGYHLVFQTTRGRFDSEGDPLPFFDAAADGRATMEWIAAQPWFNGALGTWGPSYLGYVQWAVAADAPPYLKALVPSITGSHLGGLMVRDGALALDTGLRWVTLIHLMDPGQRQSVRRLLREISPPALDRRLAPAFAHLPLAEADAVALGRPVAFYREWLDRTDLTDPHWAPINHHATLARVQVPVYLVSGWYDILLRELLDDYAALRAAGQTPYLTIGPWAHTDAGVMLAALRGGLAWFDAHLNGDATRLPEGPVRLYVMGAGEWRTLADWPPPSTERRFFLADAGRLGPEPAPAGSAPDHYRYNPADPTPSLGGPLLMHPSGPLDNRPLEARPDVLTYTTAPLAADLEVIGTPRLELYVRSSLPYTDFFGRLCDVQPDGRSINICDGLLRVAPGTGAGQPDGSLRLAWDLWPTAHRFRRGHRLRLQVSSGAHPRWSRNPGTGEPLSTATRLLAADQTIYHDPDHPSALVLPLNVP
jgi:putative CocE/NonD family hydrolase